MFFRFLTGLGIRARRQADKRGRIIARSSIAWRPFRPARCAGLGGLGVPHRERIERFEPRLEDDIDRASMCSERGREVSTGSRVARTGRGSSWGKYSKFSPTIFYLTTEKRSYNCPSFAGRSWNNLRCASVVSGAGESLAQYKTHVVFPNLGLRLGGGRTSGPAQAVFIAGPSPIDGRQSRPAAGIVRLRKSFRLPND